MEIKQKISKLATGYWRNQKGNKKISRNKWKWKHDNLKPTQCSKSSSKGEVYSNTIPLQETRKTSNRQLNFTYNNWKKKKNNNNKKEKQKPQKLVEGNKS